MVQLPAFLKKRHENVLTIVPPHEKSKRSRSALFPKRWRSKNLQKVASSPSAIPSKARPLKSSLKNNGPNAQETKFATSPAKRPRSVKKAVRWKYFHETIPPTLKCYDHDNELWWTAKELKEKRCRGALIAKNEAAAHAYIMACKQAYMCFLPELARQFEENTHTPFVASDIQLDGVEEHWTERLLSPGILSGMDDHGYRGMERMTSSRKNHARAIFEAIADHSRREKSSGKPTPLAEFAREATQADRLWAHAIALGDASVVRGGAVEI